MHIEAGRHLYGGARQVGDLIGQLAARGVDNTLVCTPEQPLAAEIREADVIRLAMGGDLDVGLLGRLRREIARVQPDVVHVHSRRGADCFGGWASRLERRPAIVTRRVDAAAPWPLLPLARLKYRPYRFVVAISRAVEAQMARALGRHGRQRLCVIPSAVETRRFAPDAAARTALIEAFALPADAAIVGIVAQLIARKGHRWLFACLPELVRRQRNLCVLCFGRGPLGGALARQVAELGLEDHVRFAGFRADLPRLLPGLDLLAHPARREGLGVALLEAMSCGVPVVAAPSGGVVDILTSGVEGLLVPLADARAWVDAIGSLLADSARRSRMGAAGRARVRREHSPELMAERYMALYAEAGGE